MDNNDSSWLADVTNDTTTQAQNIVTTSAPYESFYLRSQFVTGLFCYPIVCFFGLTGNALSIIVLTWKKMASSTNLCLRALSVSGSIKLINDSFYFLVILLLHTDPPAGQRAYRYKFISLCTLLFATCLSFCLHYIMVDHKT